MKMARTNPLEIIRVDGIRSLVEHPDGSMTFGFWSDDFPETRDLVITEPALRQMAAIASAARAFERRQR